MLKLKLHTLITSCEESTHWERPWCWERLRGGGEGGDRGWDGWMASLIQGTWVWANSETYSGGQGSLVFCSPWGCKESDIKSQTSLSNWTTIIMCQRLILGQVHEGECNIKCTLKHTHTHNVTKWTLSMKSGSRRLPRKILTTTAGFCSKFLRRKICQERDLFSKRQDGYLIEDKTLRGKAGGCKSLDSPSASTGLGHTIQGLNQAFHLLL